MSSPIGEADLTVGEADLTDDGGEDDVRVVAAAGFLTVFGLGIAMASAGFLISTAFFLELAMSRMAARHCAVRAKRRGGQTARRSDAA